MELIKINEYTVVYQKQGNDRNGNPIYIINIFDEKNYNCNYLTKQKTDKYNNIKLTSYCINDTIKHLLSTIKK